jgi:hypothetical protein
MNILQRIRILDRDQAIDGLIKLRQEWEETGSDLLQAQIGVGSLMGDAAAMIGLSLDEQRIILGDQLYNDLVKITR